MDRWIGKVAVVTGASAGIGEAIVKSLVEHGVKVVGLARRLEKMKEMAEELKGCKGSFHPVECDLRKESDILRAFDVAKELGGVDIVINNAGLVVKKLVIEDSTENFKNILDVNVLAAAICTREGAKSMRERNVEGHIILINSVVGHNATLVREPISLYQPSKYALTGLAEILRMEMSRIEAPIKVTNLSPGMVKTEIISLEEWGPHVYDQNVHLMPKDIADSVLYVLGTPPNVEIRELTITAVNENIGGKPSTNKN